LARTEPSPADPSIAYPAEPSSHQPEQPGDRAREVRVLVADDEADIRLVVATTLTAEGLTVVADAVDGHDAVVSWRVHQPDVVVMDVRMPGMSGLEAAETMLDERRDQPIVLFSAGLDGPVRARAVELGISACLDKNEIRQLPGLVRDLGLDRMPEPATDRYAGGAASGPPDQIRPGTRR
jgi:CheY-like chemotaxis protein